MKTITALLLLCVACVSCIAQTQSERQQFIRVEAPVIALVGVRVIDGTGAAPLEKVEIVFKDGTQQVSDLPDPLHRL